MSVSVLFQGTDNQQRILREGWAKLKFPWSKLTRYATLTVGWQDLNNGQFAAKSELKLNAPHDHEHEPEDPEAPPHVHVKDPVLGEGHSIARKEEGKWRIAGVFWTSGKIYIDYYYEQRESTAHAILGAEAAHFVDFGLPYTQAHKDAITRLFHPQGADTHTWWERQSYSSEYYTLIGEANMDLWVLAYSDMNLGAWPNHPSTEAMGDELRKILDIPRTDASPAPADPIMLSGRGWVTNFGNGRAKLEWKGAQGANVSIWRNDARLQTTPNDGLFLNNLGAKRGTFRYQVRDGQGKRSNTLVVQV